jgi:signal transduction histidine kinase
MQELTSAKRQAEAALASKDRVLAAISHDLRQPLQAIVLSLDRLALLSSEGAQHLSRAIIAARNLARGLDHILAVARIESGMREPRIEPVELGQLLSECAEECRPIAERKGLQLRLVSTSARVQTDREFLFRILQNLISNAIKYTERGRVLVGVRRRQPDTICIEVHDTGVGIPSDQLGKIFDEFHRVDGTRQDGVGLGLAIVRRFADLLGHKLSVHSVPDKGSCFSVKVPSLNGKIADP